MNWPAAAAFPAPGWNPTRGSSPSGMLSPRTRPCGWEREVRVPAGPATKQKRWAKMGAGWTRGRAVA